MTPDMSDGNGSDGEQRSAVPAAPTGRATRPRATGVARPAMVPAPTAREAMTDDPTAPPVGAGPAGTGSTRSRAVPPRSPESETRPLPDRDETSGSRQIPVRVSNTVWGALARPSIWALLIAIVIGGAAAVAEANYQRTRPPVYRSEAIVLIDNPAALATDANTIYPLSQVREKYVGLLQSDLIIQPVATQLGIPPSAVAGRAYGIPDPGSLNIFVIANSGDAGLARRLAQATADQLVVYVTAEQAALPASISPLFRIRMAVVRSASDGVRVSPNHHKEITSGLEYGVVALIVVYVIAQLEVDWMRRRKSRR